MYADKTAPAPDRHKDWMDLSGLANRQPWPLPQPSRVPDLDLIEIAARFYGCNPDCIIVLGDPNGLRQRLGLPAPALTPDSMHRLAYLGGSRGTDAVLIESPDRHSAGRWTTEQITWFARHADQLIIDESLGDPRKDLSMIPDLPQNALIMRGMNAFWGINLGFLIGHPQTLSGFSDVRQPEKSDRNLAAQALQDSDWRRNMTVWLAEAALHLDQIMTAQAGRLTGGTHLFRLYEWDDAQPLHALLHRHRIKVQRSADHPNALRFALPANPEEFRRLRAVLA